MKIAMIEDDHTISFAVKTFLAKHQIATTIFNNLYSIENINIHEFDLLILDVNLPDGSGLDYLKWIREFSDIPVILLTVKSDDEFVLKGFLQGADEYITKPFSLPILKARIDNVLKRKETNSQNLIFHDLCIDILSKNAKICGTNIPLNKHEFSILEILLENKDVPVVRQRIIDSVWGYDLYEVNDNTLTVTVKRLRNKLEKYGKHIKTIRGIGYMWESECDEKI